MNAVAEKNLRIAMQSAIQDVLMEGEMGELGLEKFERLEQMVQGSKLFLSGLNWADRELDPLEAAAKRIEAARLLKLGFSTEFIEATRTASERERRESTERLIQSAETHGIGDDDDDYETEAEELYRTPVDAPISVPLHLVQQTVMLLKGSDGDVAESLEELLSACSVTPETASDSILPVETGHVVMACVGLATCPEVPAREVGAELRNILVQETIGWLPEVDRAILHRVTT